MNYKDRIFAIALALIFSLGASFLLLPSQPAYAYTLSTSRWSSGTRQIDGQRSSVKDNYLESLKQAAANYNSSTDVSLKVITSIRGGNWHAKVYAYGNTGWEGRSTWFLNGGKTSSAVSEINATSASTYTVARLKVLWLHELAHVWGLGHVPSMKRVMYASASDAYLYGGVRSLTSDEIAGINSLY